MESKFSATIFSKVINANLEMFTNSVRNFIELESIKMKSVCMTENQCRFYGLSVFVQLLSKELTSKLCSDLAIHRIQNSEKVRASDMPSFMKNVDWKLLAAQKDQLQGLETSGLYQGEELKSLEGLVNLISSMQDSAVDDYGATESEIFPNIAPMEYFEDVESSHRDENDSVCIDGYFHNSDDGILVGVVDKSGEVKLGTNSKPEYLESPKVQEAIKLVLDKIALSA